jgi:hypothetical protein
MFMIEALFKERSIDLLAERLAGPLHENQPDITDAEINQAARNFVGFIRVLREADVEQKSRERSQTNV